MMKSLLKIALPLASFTKTDYWSIREKHEIGYENNTVIPINRFFNDSGKKFSDTRF